MQKKLVASFLDTTSTITVRRTHFVRARWIESSYPSLSREFQCNFSSLSSQPQQRILVVLCALRTSALATHTRSLPCLWAILSCVWFLDKEKVLSLHEENGHIFVPCWNCFFFYQFSPVSFLWKPMKQIVSWSSIPSNLQRNDKHIFPTGRDVNCMSIFLPLLVGYTITIAMLMMGDVDISLAKCHSQKYKSICRLHWLLVASSINPIAKAVLWLIFWVWFIPRLC